MVAPALLALIAAGVSAAGSIGSAALSRNPKETKLQKQKRNIGDALMESITGNGPYSDLFNMDEDAFQKSFIDPAKSRFKNQWAPQIQQSYIASGQQRGTGLDDTLTRAGVDMDQLLNEQYMNFQQGAQNRKSNVLSSILGSGNGAPEPLSTGDKFRQGASGYLGSNAFESNMKNILSAYSNTMANRKRNSQIATAREGYYQ